MYIKDGMVYAGQQEPMLEVVGVRPLKDCFLWVRFSTGEAKLVDMKPLFDQDVFAPLAEPSVFEEVYLDYGSPVWKDGEIDIAPEYLYEHGMLQKEFSSDIA